MLDVLVENVLKARQVLPVPLALEHIATLFEWPGAEMDEITFIREVCQRTGCQLVLDLANLFSNCHNHGGDPLDFLRQLSREDIAYIHVAGGRFEGGLYHDTHARELQAPVYSLLEHALRFMGPLPVLIERDDHFGTRQGLEMELASVVALLQHGGWCSAQRAPTRPEQLAERAPDLAQGKLELWERQKQLLRCLLLSDSPPPGFDPERLTAAACLLSQKAARVRAKRAAARQGSSAVVAR
jgi:hypothetical protein